MEDTKKVTIRISDEEHETLLKYCRKFNLTLNSVVILALMKLFRDI